MEAELSQYILTSLQQRNRIQTKPYQQLLYNYNQIYESNKNLVHLCNNYSKEETKERIKKGYFIFRDPKLVEELNLKLRTLEQQLTEMSMNHSEKLSTMLDLKSDTEILQSGLKNAERETEALRNRLTECEEDIREKATQIQELKSVNSVLDAELKKSQELADAMIKKISNLEKDNAELVNRMLELKGEQMKKMNELNDLNKSILKHEKDLGGLSESTEFDMRPACDFNFANSQIRPTKPIHKILAHKDEVNSVKYNDGGAILITGGADALVKVYDVITGSEKSTLRGASAAILDLAISPGTEMVIAGTVDCKALLWNLRTGRIRHTLTGHGSKVCSVCFFNNKAAVATASQDRSIRIWDVTKGFCQRTLSSYSNCNSVTLSHTDSLLATGHYDGHLRIWSPITGKQTKDLAIHELPITSCLISESGNHIVTSSKDNTLAIIDIRTFETLGKLSHRDYHSSSNFSKACWSSDGRYIVSGGSSGDIFLWDAMSMDIADILRSGHSCPVIACAWQPREAYFASVDSVGGLVLWG